jgi:hypothetical protein
LDVHRNKGGLKDTIPFVVIVQSSLFDGYRRRMVVPLVRRTALPVGTSLAGSRMNPEFLIEPRKSSWMHPSVPRSARSARRDNDAGFCPLGGTTRLGGSGGAQSGA